MKIVHIVPGTGGSFYCQNCVRDGALVKALQNNGHDILMVPMYLPLVTDEPDILKGTPVFFGAINSYLKQIWPWFRNAPDWLINFLNAPFFLKLAAKNAGSTSADGLEDLTLSMLHGSKGNQAAELEQLISWLKTEIKPDVLYIANALLLGLVPEIKRELNIPVVCALQDEAPWLEKMEPEKLAEIWETIRELAGYVDCFLPVSQYYCDKICQKLGLDQKRIKIIPNGINPEVYKTSSLPSDPYVIGYLSRQMPGLGLDHLISAFILLSENEPDLNIELKITGGMTGKDQSFVKSIKKQLSRKKIAHKVHFIDDYDRVSRVEFLQSITLMTVPTDIPEAFGTFILEALASGVPVIQPDIGAYPEILNQGGGWIIKDNNPVILAEAIKSALLEPQLLKQKSLDGISLINSRFNVTQIADSLAELYQDLVKSQ